ncbi:Uncharacterised protein [Serratia quinivorans]|uniref:hypothetical protein n=1 Tax=Serratia quinivorans TaxID=137545 RepID=UPI00217C40FF|nr:hypothetical protein [Serratia quinivorans]CAI1722689.1 Uncharacterised protein [Serratia quinivorans]
MSKKNRDKSEFVQVEYEVLDLVSYNGLQLNSHMKLVLASARSYQRTDNVYYESNPTLQLRTGLKEGAVTSLIKKMEDAGLIRVERIKGVGNRYYPLALDLTLAEFIPEKGDIRDILREQSVEQPELALEPVEREVAVQAQEFNQPTQQGPADEYANDFPAENYGYQGSNDQDQTTGNRHVVGNPVGTSFTSVFAVVPVIDDAFAVAETFAVGIPEAQPVEPATSEAWLDAPFTPHGELIPEAVQYCLEQGVTEPDEQKHFVRSLDDPDYPAYVKPIHNPTLAPVLEWEDVPF